MSFYRPGADPVALMMALLSLSKSKRKPRPLTPEQLAQRAAEAERDEWNAQVAARKAAKKLKKGSA